MRKEIKLKMNFKEFMKIMEKEFPELEGFPEKEMERDLGLIVTDPAQKIDERLSHETELTIIMNCQERE